MARVTPLRQQYLDIKKEYPDCILFFRLGDFQECLAVGLRCEVGHCVVHVCVVLRVK